MPLQKVYNINMSIEIRTDPCPFGRQKGEIISNTAESTTTELVTRAKCSFADPDNPERVVMGQTCPETTCKYRDGNWHQEQPSEAILTH